jgi:hypothetical protein
MKVGWYYHRLRAMTVSELAHRVTERWKHRSDASFAESLRGIELGEVAEGVIALPERVAAPEAVKQRLARDAASLMRGDWKLFGWREVNVGTPPRWHRDAACGVELSPDVLANRLNHRDLPDGADARTVWEINRWSEMVRLAMHGWVNGDINAAQTALTWLEDWCDKNPVGYGINWTSPLEAGLRLVNFVWFDSLVHELECRLQPDKTSVFRLKPALQRLAERIVPAHAAWVSRYRSFGSSANNHLLGELVGLLHAVKRWPALERAICPADRLWEGISQCVLEQFAEDGGNKEQALHYHLFAWEMAWHAARLMRVTDGPVMDRLQKAAEFLVHVAHDGEQWEYGDNDDAQIVPLTLEREHAVAEWRAWMRGRVGRQVGASIAFWLGASPLDGVPDACAVSQWWLASESGMAACEHDGWKLRLDGSPLGYGAMAAHGHCDALHVSIWDGPHALVIDPGTGGYFGMKEKRAALAAWPSHNGPQPTGGFHTPRRMGAFLWSDHHVPPRLEASHSAGVTARMQHEGGHFTRAVELSANGTILVSDCTHGNGRWTVNWFLAPDCRVITSGLHAFSLLRGGRTWNVAFSGEGIISEVRSGEASGRYGQFENCAVLQVSASSRLQSAWSRSNDF